MATLGGGEGEGVTASYIDSLIIPLIFLTVYFETIIDVQEVTKRYGEVPCTLHCFSQ